MGKFISTCLLICILNLTAGIASNELTDEKPKTGVEDSYQNLGFELHNEIRSKHGVPHLKMNETLSLAAQQYADYLIGSNSFKNKLEPGYVKNLYQYRGTIGIEPRAAMDHAVKKWYATVTEYNWKLPTVTPFSALVWKSTTDVGFGLSSRGTRTVVVAAYSPPGNVLGDNGDHFKNNVLRRLQ